MNKLITIAVCLTMTALLHAQTTIFVKPDGTGDGTTWANACNFENAVVSAPLNGRTEIWVQKGTYYPSKMLVVPDSVKIYGGFAGTETEFLQRNFSANPTIIDGQHKIGSVFRLEQSAVIDGLTIQNGNANGNEQKNGGGIWADENTIIENCIVKNNTALLNGGGIFAKGKTTIINSTVENNSANGSGINTFGNCVTIARASFSGTPCETPTIAVQPATDAVSLRQNSTFAPLTVTASGSAPFTYQWFCNATDSPEGGFNLGGGFNAQTDTYKPHALVVGDMYYYCVVSNACGSTISNVSGKHTVTLPVSAAVHCGSNTFNFGTIYYGNTSNTNINTHATTINGIIDGVPMTQVWSAPVLTSGCNKTTFSGGTCCSYNADCRNNGSYGHMFSWCAVKRFGAQLCPAPWRVPTFMDFVNLDKALGGNGLSHQFEGRDFAADFAKWNGSYSGVCWSDGRLTEQGLSLYHWTQSDLGSEEGYLSQFSPAGVSPICVLNKNYGFQLRCVR